MILDTLREFHTQLFFNLHALVGYSERIDSLIYFFAQEADLLVIALAMLFVLIFQHKEHKDAHDDHKTPLIKELFVMTYAVFFAWFVTYLLKQVIGGLRPFEFYQALEPLFLYAGGDSFPSGHATVFSALALVLTIFHRRAGVMFVTLAILISIARVIAGVHYPIDILAGWLIGGGVAYLVYDMFQTRSMAVLKRRERYKKNS
jgi:membrane-associated phospholipid phosphatase